VRTGEPEPDPDGERDPEAGAGAEGERNASARAVRERTETSRLVERARSRLNDTWAGVEDARPRIPALDAAFDIRAYDQEVGGGLLAGALAFRLFLWLVPFALVSVTALGWLVQGTAVSQADLASQYGISGIAAEYVGEASRQSSTSRAILVLIGVYALYLASLGAVRALRLAHVLAWRLPASRFKGSLKAALWFAGGGLALVLVAAAVNQVRGSLPGPGLVLLIMMIVVVMAIWLAASWRLPHPPEVGLTDLLPGAIVFGIGAEALHLVTVLWYGHKIEHSSELYGGLGAAVGLLAWLYLLGRLAIASAVVNATLWRRKSKITPGP
jgi:uncharacterized BrkB/YihY/UPF0761 family membrane protein